jgi:hypothetical protein
MREDHPRAGANEHAAEADSVTLSEAILIIQRLKRRLAAMRANQTKLTKELAAYKAMMEG